MKGIRVQGIWLSDQSSDYCFSDGVFLSAFFSEGSSAFGAARLALRDFLTLARPYQKLLTRPAVKSPLIDWIVAGKRVILRRPEFISSEPLTSSDSRRTVQGNLGEVFLLDGI